MNKIELSFAIFFLLLPFIFLNLGKWMDVTEKPVKSDIIVCLGGGTIDRVKKSIKLFNEGYAQKKLFLLLGESWYNQPYIKKNYPKLPIVINERPKNTVEEIRFIRKFMGKHNCKIALIVTDPPHSRRVTLLNSLASAGDHKALDFHIVGSGVKWWNREHYWSNERARRTAVREFLKIPYGAWKLFAH